MAAVTGDDGVASGFVPTVPFGVWGDSGTGGNGVVGSSSQYTGVAGFTLVNSNLAAGVYGQGPRVGVAGGVAGSTTAPSDRVGVYGTGSNGDNLGGTGVRGESDIGTGVAGTSTSGTGVSGTSTKSNGVCGVSSDATGVFGLGGDTGVLGWGGTYGGQFFGDVNVVGSISKGGGGFTVDHPLDPANRYLRHSFVESSEMKNIYDGVAVCDADGEATVQVPEWFESLNRDFRYQLTPIGRSAPGLFISAELEGHQFTLAGGTPGLRVSWQVTGVRHDAWARANPLVVDEEKPAAERGHYLYPEAHGHPGGANILSVRLEYLRRGQPDGTEETEPPSTD